MLSSLFPFLTSTRTEASINNPLGRYFFNSNNGISSKKLDAIVQQYGLNVLVGVDPGENDTPSDVAKPQLDYQKQRKIPTHIYLVGPGMMSWSQQERNQIKRFAKSVGIDINKKDWQKNWFSFGWKQKNLQQFQYYFSNYNAYSCEIDNLDSAIQNDPDKTISFFKELKADLQKHNISTKLMLKNLSIEQLNAVVDNIDSLGLNFLCEYAIFEKGTGNPKTQIELCKSIKIQAITPINGLNDTNHYGVVASGVPYKCNEQKEK